MEVEAPRIALCHEWLANRFGSEKTFEVMAQAFPSADLYALTMDRAASFAFRRPVSTTLLDRLGALRQRRDLQLPLMPLAWRYASRKQYDIVITSSHACVKGFWPGRNALHLCYCHAPLRYVWTPDVDERRPPNAVTRWLERRLRSWDRSSARWVDDFAANSRAVAQRIDRFYGRKARVIPPPVDTAFYSLPEEPVARSYALAVSRFIPYKRVDLVVQACHRVRVPLVVAGSGPDEARLRRLVSTLGADVRFVIAPDDAALRDLYRSAGVLVVAAEEDFGMVTAEAQACGAPVVALARGGSTDIVVDGRTGLLVAEPDAQSFADAVTDALSQAFDRVACRTNAERFSVERFAKAFTEWVCGLAAARGLRAERLVALT